MLTCVISVHIIWWPCSIHIRFKRALFPIRHVECRQMLSPLHRRQKVLLNSRIQTILSQLRFLAMDTSSFSRQRWCRSDVDTGAQHCVTDYCNAVVIRWRCELVYIRFTLILHHYPLQMLVLYLLVVHSIHLKDRYNMRNSSYKPIFLFLSICGSDATSSSIMRTTRASTSDHHLEIWRLYSSHNLNSC